MKEKTLTFLKILGIFCFILLLTVVFPERENQISSDEGSIDATKNEQTETNAQLGKKIRNYEESDEDVIRRIEALAQGQLDILSVLIVGDRNKGEERKLIITYTFDAIPTEESFLNDFRTILAVLYIEHTKTPLDFDVLEVVLAETKVGKALTGYRIKWKYLMNLFNIPMGNKFDSETQLQVVKNLEIIKDLKDLEGYDVSSNTIKKSTITLEGYGREATRSFYLKNGLTRFTLFHNGKSNFIVNLLDKDGYNINLLVNEIGYFKGSKALRIEHQGYYLLDVDADSSWSIDIKQ